MPVLVVNMDGYTEPRRVRGRYYSMLVPISHLRNEIKYIDVYAVNLDVGNNVKNYEL